MEQEQQPLHADGRPVGYYDAREGKQVGGDRDGHEVGRLQVHVDPLIMLQ